MLSSYFIKNKWVKMNTLKMVRPDEKGRITLGYLAEGVSRFAISKDEHNRLILEPFVEIPAKETWLFKNTAALKQVKKGLKDSSEGRIYDRGSFAQYLNEKDDV